FFQIGGFFALALFFYAAYPFVVYLVRGMRYGAANDDRLQAWPPLPAQMGTLAWWYVAFFASFAVVFLLMTRGIGSSRIALRPVEPKSLTLLIVGFYLVIQLLAIVVNAMYPFDIRSYSDAYLAMRQLPHMV